MAPSHYLKQCGLIIKLINKVMWHLSQWITMKDLNIPISKMRLKLTCWDNFTPSPEILHLSSTDNSFVCVMVVELIFIVTIFNPSGFCLLKGNKVPSPWSFVFFWSYNETTSKSGGFDYYDRPSNLTQAGFKLIFQPVWPWNLMDDLEKQ